MKAKNILTRLSAAALAVVLSACVATSQRLKNADGSDSSVQLQVYQADEKKAAPTVLIGHGSGGVGASYHEWANTVKSWGYNAVVIDHYTLRGIAAFHNKMVDGARPKERAKDFADVAEWVQKQPWHKGKMVIMGFSYGGSGVLAYANASALSNMNLWTGEKQDPVAAVVSFYPACYWDLPPYKLRMPVLMILAEKDDLADPKNCSPILSPLYDVRVLENATHAFDQNLPVVARRSFTHRYSDEAVTKSKNLSKEFLAKYLN